MTYVAQAESRDALEGKGPWRWPQRRVGGRLEEVAEAVGAGYRRLEMPLKPALAVREHRLGALKGGGGGYLTPSQCIPGPAPSPAPSPAPALFSCSLSNLGFIRWALERAGGSTVGIACVQFAVVRSSMKFCAIGGPRQGCIGTEGWGGGAEGQC